MASQSQFIDIDNVVSLKMNVLCKEIKH